MAVQTPGTDPLYAWDVPGWTNQKMGASATAGLNLIESGGATPATLGGSSGAALNGYLGWTNDPISNAADTLLPATNTFYGSLIYLPEGGVTTKLIVNETTNGTTTHAYGVLASVSSLSNLAATVIALTADKTSGTVDTFAGVAWATPGTSVVLAPGFYYAGVITTWSGQPKFAGLTAAQLANYDVNASATVLRNVTSTTQTGANIAVGQVLTLVAQSSLGSAFAAIY
jgi:hypothetical protein